MKKKLRIGIVGCGAIGSSLAKMIVADFAQRAILNALYDIDIKKAESISKKVSKNKHLAVATLSALVNKTDLVIEAASAKSAKLIVHTALSHGRDCLIMSVGGIIEHVGRLSDLARKTNSTMYIPSGAISGIDALKAARIGKIKKVILTTSKNPLSFQGNEYLKRKKMDLNNITKVTLLYNGNVSEAVKFFPQNINVAAVMSLAGVGANATKVKIIASPFLKSNVHEIKIESEAATIYTRTENKLHPDNPKTSFLAVLSAAAVLKQILGPLKVGT